MSRIAVICLLVASVGCVTIEPQLKGVADTPNNLRGDISRKFIDVLAARVVDQGSNVVFEVSVAAPFPEAAAMAGGKRVDYIWLIDIDRNPATGQCELGNDYNIHLWFDETGWRPEFFKVSPVAQNDGIAVDFSRIGIELYGQTARLSVPREYLPSRQFDWRLHAMTGNAPNWQPYTENPMTAVSHVSRVGR